MRAPTRGTCTVCGDRFAFDGKKRIFRHCHSGTKEGDQGEACDGSGWFAVETGPGPRRVRLPVDREAVTRTLRFRSGEAMCVTAGFYPDGRFGEVFIAWEGDQAPMTGYADGIALALSMAAQSGSLLPAGVKGEPVYPLITWMDGRTKELVQQWRDEGIQDQIRPISGWSLYPGLCLPTIAWLSRYDPELFTLARHYFSVNDFIAYRLTGQYCTNPSNAGGMQLVDIHTGRWSERLTALAGITPEQLSPIQPSGAVVGKIKLEVCQVTGLSKNTVLINGGHDQGR